MKFDQLIEYNKRNVFLQKLCRKRGRDTVSRPLFVFYTAQKMKKFLKGNFIFCAILKKLSMR